MSEIVIECVHVCVWVSENKRLNKTNTARQNTHFLRWQLENRIGEQQQQEQTATTIATTTPPAAATTISAAATSTTSTTAVATTTTALRHCSEQSHKWCFKTFFFLMEMQAKENDPFCASQSGCFAANWSARPEPFSGKVSRSTLLSEGSF